MRRERAQQAWPKASKAGLLEDIIRKGKSSSETDEAGMQSLHREKLATVSTQTWMISFFCEHPDVCMLFHWTY